MTVYRLLVWKQKTKTTISKETSLEIVVFTVNERENICIVGLNHQAVYATAEFSVFHIRSL